MPEITYAEDLPKLSTIALENVITRRQLRAQGISNNVIAVYCRPGGPWRRLLPGVILLENREPNRRQQLLAAVAYTGHSAITGIDALRAFGLDFRPARCIRLLVPTSRRLLSQEFVRVERTTRVPTPIVQHRLPFAPPSRAVIDAARHEQDPARLRRLVTEPVYRGLCTVDQLSHELERGNQRGSAAVRQILRNLGLTEPAKAIA